MIDTATIKTIKETVNLLKLAEDSVTLKRISKHPDAEYAGPCPRCGGKDRFHIHRNLFMCRHCHPKWGDAIEYVQWTQGLSFQQAAESLGSGAQQPAVQAVAQPPPPPPTPTWNVTAVERKLARYQAVMAGSPAATYLAERGFCPETWQAYGFGYDALRLAVAMPWYKGKTLYAINYRLLNVPKERRFQVEKDGTRSGYLYGAHALTTDLTQKLPNGSDPLARRSLFLVEGELNCASIWQALYPMVDVLSMGSESKAMPESFPAIAMRYRCVIVWKDRRAEAVKTAARLPGAIATWSESNNGEHDANDMLQAGTLRRHIATILAAATPEKYQEELAYDLADAGL